MESLSVGKMNFRRRGKSTSPSNLEPRHGTLISFQAWPSVRPANWPLTTWQSRPVSHASPIGDLRSYISGKRGASERAPHRRSENTGSMRNGSGDIGQALTFYAAASEIGRASWRERVQSSRVGVGARK